MTEIFIKLDENYKTLNPHIQATQVQECEEKGTSQSHNSNQVIEIKSVK